MISDIAKQAMLAQISTRKLLAMAALLDAADRLPGGAGLVDAVSQVAREADSLRGLEVEPLSYPWGADRRYFSWSDQRRPFVERAELWLLSPEGGGSPLCRRADNFACSMGAYRSTPEEGEVLEVVDVGFGTRASDYRTQRWAGKLALCSGHFFEAAMLEALAERGAEGLLAGPGAAMHDPARVVPRRLGDPELFGGHRPFGFNLSGRQYSRLANLLATGDTLKVRAVLRLTSDLGAMPGLRVTLPGGDLRQERVVLLAHLAGEAGPLATACLVQVMGVLAAVTVAGALPPMRRDLDLVVLPDLRSTVAWLQQEAARPGKVSALVQLGLPSADSAATLTLGRPPSRTPSFLGDLMEDHLEWASKVDGAFRTELPLSVRRASGLGGHPTLMFADRDVGIPALWLGGRRAPHRDLHGGGAPHGPLHRLCAALSSAAADLCSLGEDDLPRLLSGSQLRGTGRLMRRAARLRRESRVTQDTGDPATRAEVRHQAWHFEASMSEGLRREQETLETCAAHLGGPGRSALRLAEARQSLAQAAFGLLTALRSEVEAAGDARRGAAPRRRALSALERRAAAVQVRRTFRGPLPTVHLLREAAGPQRAWLTHNAGALEGQPVAEELVQWADGRLTLLDILDQLRLDHPDVDLKLIWRYLEALQSAGWVTLEEDRGIQEV